MARLRSSFLGASANHISNLIKTQSRVKTKLAVTCKQICFPGFNGSPSLLVPRSFGERSRGGEIWTPDLSVPNAARYPGCATPRGAPKLVRNLQTLKPLDSPQQRSGQHSNSLLLPTFTTSVMLSSGACFGRTSAIEHVSLPVSAGRYFGPKSHSTSTLRVISSHFGTKYRISVLNLRLQ